ncbi:hypothetical protein C8R44DRAFT_778565 [Mycena epipterygia]|nr:hypothetical protein C8R44DRAFT_778565 [Mycena epipterygia]
MYLDVSYLFTYSHTHVEFSYLFNIPYLPSTYKRSSTCTILSSLVQSENALYNTYPCRPDALAKQQTLKPSQQHLDIAPAELLLVSPEAAFDEEMFVFRGSLDWDEGACNGNEVLLIGFIDAERLRNAVEEWRSRV